MFNKKIELKGLEGTEIRKVFAKEKPIFQTEFFQAAQAGIQPRKCFVIRRCDYFMEEFLRFNNYVYYIYRTFDSKNEMIELYCEVRIGDGKYFD